MYSSHTTHSRAGSGTSISQPLDALVRDAFVMISQLDERGLLLQKRLIEKEGEIREQISNELIEAKKTASTTLLERIINVVKDALMPASLVVAGIAAGATTVLTGGTAFLALGAVAVGSLFFLESVCDNYLQHTVASWLGQGSTEDTQNWFERIHMFAQISQFVLSLGVSPSNAVQVAQAVTKSAIEAAKAGVDWRKNTQTALMIELKDALDSSEQRINDYQENVAALVQSFTINQERLLSWQRSQKNVIASIMN
jgi:hypothetical protein